jgi:hypothetical protein
MIWLKRKTALLACLILLSAFIFSCKSDTAGTDDNSSLFDFSSDTEKAVELVRAANEELMRIKILYNENQDTLKDLKEASQKGESGKVKIISKTLVDTINTGFVFADSAKSKIQEARELNIHQDYKDYLGMKEQSLDKQVEAFQFLYDAAKLLSDTAGSQDKEQAEKARFVFKEKEENFQSKMEEAKKISAQADDLAKESMQRAK